MPRSDIPLRHGEVVLRRPVAAFHSARQGPNSCTV